MSQDRMGVVQEGRTLHSKLKGSHGFKGWSSLASENYFIVKVPG